MKPKDSFIPDDYFDRLPLDHPMREVTHLTLFQQLACPVLLWFFDRDRNRATGRSTLAAHVMLELAKRGYSVEIDDVSLSLVQSHGRERSRHILTTLEDVIRRDFPRDLFRIDTTHRILTYAGRRPS